MEIIEYAGYDGLHVINPNNKYVSNQTTSKQSRTSNGVPHRNIKDNF